MSQLLIQKYLNDLSDLRRVSGTTREGVVSEAFKDLLKGYAKAHDLIFIPQYELPRQDGNRRIVDGALVYDLRVPFGYWEAKDEEDDLDKEIAAKLRRGYPRDNIVFEDSRTAVLMQYGNEVMRCPVDDTDKLPHLLDFFFKYERPEVADFRKAVIQFKADLPEVLEALRAMIEKAQKESPAFHKGATKFLKHAQETINPAVTAEDVREMLIQHILTEEIFSKVFDEDDFHRQNNVAKELYALEGLFFTGALKKTTLKGLESYYNAIRTTAHQIATHTEKQTFLKVIYEGFYKVYNKKAADRLGVVYTPNEIVRFMVESADWLCQKHFEKALIDKGVEILDPATGTGTFICELMEHFRGQRPKLRYKYLEELHANEVAILPYYVANLNIEATYAAINPYEEYPNLCFVDTLDNTAALRSHRGQQGNLFGAVSEENVERINRQNKKKISIVIGNPPYNANQLNENENNKNREYPEIDQRIKNTYIGESKAQKTKLYDMYARFFRWASDRIDENGIVAFVSNSSFIHKPSFDGFRKSSVAEFNEIWIVDLKGDARSSGESRRRQGGNVFGDQIKVGISISFFIKKRGAKGCRIFYQAVRDYAKVDEKIDFLKGQAISERRFDELKPDKNNNWVAIAENDFESFLPIADKETKSVRVAGQERSIFKLYSLGISTNRDEWVYDIDRSNLQRKAEYITTRYARMRPSASEFPDDIKWSRNLKRRLHQGRKESFQIKQIVRASYRPYGRRWLYQSGLFIDEAGSSAEMFPPGSSNLSICFSDIGSRTDYCVLGVDGLTDLHFGAAVDAYQQVPRFRFAGDKRFDNITDWALSEFRSNYKPNKTKRPITKDMIFNYVYGVLYDPIYREKYAQNLKREFPRIPFYADFWKWAGWGGKLLALHIGYETVKPWKLKRVEVRGGKLKEAKLLPKTSLKADRENGIIILDSETQLTGIPSEAWAYKLGNRSALEWILDQHKEKKPKDPTIREKFNSYRFADHKEKVIDLLMRVTRVSVETMEIIGAMKEEKR
jgi:predicted helicase